MSNYDNTNTGILYRNHDKDAEGANPKWPDFKGSVNVDGVEYWISAWTKEGKEGGKLAGKKFFSMQLRSKDGRASTSGYDMKAAEQGTKLPEKPAPVEYAFDDDIPF